ncbi:hypothetical protein OESDEN_22363 [Oesophagostomum dentatum]|uniref:SH2 domain-containing protein n=1 Tax=Oesophagostomum dentatum TaxID=61180 RepID=A0A0B1S3G7_OESDE|nr:hypothetical protein OESDEN_22363 [Oesophagostomum dentatum]
MGGGQLCDQIWYWGNAEKSLISEVMQDQPEGTFIVRDASSPGDYTLTVSYNLLRVLFERECFSLGREIS